MIDFELLASKLNEMLAALGETVRAAAQAVAQSFASIAASLRVDEGELKRRLALYERRRRKAAERSRRNAANPNRRRHGRQHPTRKRRR